MRMKKIKNKYNQARSFLLYFGLVLFLSSLMIADQRNQGLSSFLQKYKDDYFSNFSMASTGLDTEFRDKDKQPGVNISDIRDKPPPRDFEDTAIIITSSWIATHPTLYFIDKVMDSLMLIEGLSSTVPIYIAVDGLPFRKNLTINEKRQVQLDKYIENLYHKYSRHNNIQILVSPAHYHISGNVQRMLDLIKNNHTGVEFVYYLQHDFAFRPGVNHTALVKTARENDDIKIIRFLYRCCRKEDRKGDTCYRNKPEIKSNGIVLKPTRKYSDNNHFAKFDQYKELIDDVGPTPRAPEGPLQLKFKKDRNCSKFGLYTYSVGSDRVFLNHLDGRKTSDKKLEFKQNKSNI